MKDVVDMTGAEEMLQSMVTQASAVPVKPVAPAGDIPLDAQGHVIPPPGAETLGQALTSLPHDAADWVGSQEWFSGFDDWLHHLSFAAPVAGLAHVLSGGLLQWLTVAFLGLKIIDLGRGLMAPGQRVRGPVSLVYYRIPAQTVEPVVAYLTRSAQVDVRDTQADGQGNALLGIPIYHSGKSDRAFLYLQKKTGLAYTRI